jgi:SAM-dependent methyltransferase
MSEESFDAAGALQRVLGALLPVGDILDGRVEDEGPPAWCEARGWAGFLLALDDADLGRAEAQGLAALAPSLAGAPADLVALADAVVAGTRLPALIAAERPLSQVERRAVTARKQAQLGALLGAVAPMAEHAARIVDVGAGSGHFTRLAADHFARAALGIERDEARLASARARAAEEAPATGAARFLALDASREPLALAATDLAVGLHACGALGDHLVVAAAAAGCDLALVSCCLQKIPDPARAPLSRGAAALVLRREILGLANLTSQPEGVEASIEATLAGREARFALLRLLRDRGLTLAPGEEMRGINRRKARGGLSAIAAPALAQRGLAPPTDAELHHHEVEARRRYALVRRLSLPRSMLGRLVEVAVILDRAARLAEEGHHVLVATVFERAATPRNVAIFASRAHGRLPRAAFSS